jgi:hypothetical protein
VGGVGGGAVLIVAGQASHSMLGALGERCGGAKLQTPGLSRQGLARETLRFRCDEGVRGSAARLPVTPQAGCPYYRLPLNALG